MNEKWKCFLIRLGWFIVFFLIIAVAAVILHEFNHVWAHIMVGGNPDAVTYFKWVFVNDFPLPISGRAQVINHWFARLGGGFFTALIYFFIGGFAKWTKSPADSYIEYTFMGIGLSHLFYSFYETLYLNTMPISEYLVWGKVSQLIPLIIYAILIRKGLKEWLFRK